MRLDEVEATLFNHTTGGSRKGPISPKTADVEWIDSNQLHSGLMLPSARDDGQTRTASRKSIERAGHEALRPTKTCITLADQDDSR